MTPNPRYAQGARLEYRIKAYQEARGYFCVRSAGSKGAIDLICLNDIETVCIQVKSPGQSVDKAATKLLEVPAAKNRKRQVWTWNRGEEHPSVLWSDGEELYA